MRKRISRRRSVRGSRVLRLGSRSRGESMIRALLLASLVAAGCYNPALPPIGYYCHPEDDPACPMGSVCMQAMGAYRCVATVGMNTDGGMLSGTIPKTGLPYTGTKNDPGLNTLKDCPDNDPRLEPNDGTSTAVDLTNSSLSPKPDMQVGKLTMMSICPKGPRPDTNFHDIDYYKVDTSTFGTTGTLTIMAEVFYDISYGDLDVGIFDSTGRLLAGDGSSMTNACTVASIGSGVYYVVVAGANNVDVNRYDMRVR